MRKNLYRNQNRVLRTGTGLFPRREPGKRDTEQCVPELPWYLWLDGRMDDHMTTCTQRATSHKCSILFSNNTLRPVYRPTLACFCSVFLFFGPTLAFISLLQSNFGACRGHQGWGQFTVSSVPLITADTKFANHPAFIHLLVFFRLVSYPRIWMCSYKWRNSLKSWPDWHESELPPTLARRQWGWLWLVGQSWRNVFCLEKSILHL